MSLSKYISTQDNFQKKPEALHLEKSAIIDFKSSENFPFRFGTFPEFKQKMIEYMNFTPTRTFSREMAKKMLNSFEDQNMPTISSKFCQLEGKGILTPNRGILPIPNKLVPLSWDTIRNLFLEGKEEGDKIILPNNSYLKELLSNSGFCMYSNQHLQSKCHFFSCPPFQVKLQRPVCTIIGFRTDMKSLKNGVEEEGEEINYNEINYDEGENDEFEEEGEIDYTDTHLPDFDNLWMD